MTATKFLKTAASIAASTFLALVGLVLMQDATNIVMAGSGFALMMGGLVSFAVAVLD